MNVGLTRRTAVWDTSTVKVPHEEVCTCSLSRSFADGSARAVHRPSSARATRSLRTSVVALSRNGCDMACASQACLTEPCPCHAEGMADQCCQCNPPRSPSEVQDRGRLLRPDLVPGTLISRVARRGYLPDLGTAAQTA